MWSLAHCQREHVGEKAQVSTRTTALSAHLAGKMALPPGYGQEHGANVLPLRRKDGSVVATFYARDVAPAKAERRAEDDYRARNYERNQRAADHTRMISP
jgi:hypothetical protein